MRTAYYVLALVVLGSLAAGGYFTRHHWEPWLASPEVHSDEPAPTAGPSEAKLLKLPPQARKNLGLTSKPSALQSYWRAIELPGVIVDRPGQSDRAVVSPAAAVVTSIHAFPGDLPGPGDRLFSLRLIGEQALTTQADLIKTVQEIEFVKKQRAILDELKKTTPVPEPRFLELDNQTKRLTAAMRAYRQELLSRGLTPDQVDGVADGRFATEIEVKVPVAQATDNQTVMGAESPAAKVLEVEQLKVELGQQVNAGQLLCLLADHREVYIEGRSFKREAPLLELAAQKGWPVRVVFTEDEGNSWPPLQSSFAIRHLSNTVDPANRTFAFYVPLTNQWRTHAKDGRAFRVWRFRPGQRVQLHVPVQEYKDVIVMPAGAVAREGADAYVFRQNGDLFERRAVHVLFEDRLNLVVANDGAVQPGVDYLAQSAAASLNRILKAQNTSGGLPPGAHFHADGSLHIPGK